MKAIVNHLFTRNYSTDGSPLHVLTPKAEADMMLGLVPDLMETCLQLYRTFLINEGPYSALQFTQILKEVSSIDPIQQERFLNNEETNHILIENELLRVVLIHWQPGKMSSIHGHPSGGCVFKVLKGKLEERRYTPNNTPELLATSIYSEGAMAYIDDEMAYHAVGNPFYESAISIHAYTPGKK